VSGSINPVWHVTSRSSVMEVPLRAIRAFKMSTAWSTFAKFRIVCLFVSNYIVTGDCVRVFKTPAAHCPMSILLGSFYVTLSFNVCLICTYVLRSRACAVKAQIPLCRLPCYVRDKPVTPPLAQVPLGLRRLPPKLSRTGKFRGTWGKSA